MLPGAEGDMNMNHTSGFCIMLLAWFMFMCVKGMMFELQNEPWLFHRGAINGPFLMSGENHLESHEVNHISG